MKGKISFVCYAFFNENAANLGKVCGNDIVKRKIEIKKQMS